MPSNKSSSKRRSQGGGRTPNTEPRVQVFKGFTGISFENSDILRVGDSVDEPAEDGNQTDLQMTYLYLQNNVRVTSNGTLETRNDIYVLKYAPPGVKFTGPALLVEQNILLAKDDGNIGVAMLLNGQEAVTTNMPLMSYTGMPHNWSAFDYYDNKIIAMTNENEIWYGSAYPGSGNTMRNSALISDPGDPPYPDGGATTLFAPVVIPFGNLTMSTSWSEETSFRVILAYTYVNEFGPTRVSPTGTFYFSAPVSEWDSSQYVCIRGMVPTGYGFTVKAIEFYFATDNAETMIFLGRTDILFGNGYEYNWYGYNDATNMWPIGNLIAPTQNYTQGVHASMMTHVDGRMYFWGDTSHPDRLYIGGNPGNLLSVSPGTGGGFVDVDPGTRQKITCVMKYKTQSGNSIVTMLTSSWNSKREQRYNLVENSVALTSEQNMKSWQAEQVAGAIGCQSPNGGLVCADGLYAVTRYGLALTTMTMEYNSQIQVTYVSDAIKQAFTELNLNMRLRNASLLELNGIIYMAFGNDYDGARQLDNVIFCYDINLKAWWTYTLNIDEPILNLMHIDCSMAQEGIGILTESRLLLLPTTTNDGAEHIPDYHFLMQTAEISTVMPMQGWQYLSQLEFHFDHFRGTMNIEVRMVDMFGRKLKVKKTITEEDLQYNYVTYMRIDQRVMSYVLTFDGVASFRMTHFLAKVYTMSNKMTQVWGFDDSISHRSSGDVHPTFKCYNDLRKAIIP